MDGSELKQNHKECLLCKLSIPILGLPSHLKWKHQISMKQYYDQFYKKEGEGICKECGKETKYKDLRYDQYCSLKCGANHARTKAIDKYQKEYGVNHNSQIKEVRDKFKKTCQEKYGSDSPLGSSIIREKIESTCMKKYGGKTAAIDPKVREKIKKTFNKKYGKDYAIGTNKVQDKIKETMNDRHGVSSYLSHPDFLEKSKDTCMEKYGVDNTTKLPERKKRTSNFFKELWKIRPNPMKGKERPDIKEKMLNGQAARMNSFISNPSQPQVELFEMVNMCFEAELNYPVEEVNRAIDIAIPDLMIAIEYDGSYWHKGKDEDDLLRQTQLEQLGWKFIRYVDRLPTMKELQDDINNIKLSFII